MHYNEGQHITHSHVLRPHKYTRDNTNCTKQKLHCAQTKWSPFTKHTFNLMRKNMFFN